MKSLTIRTDGVDIFPTTDRVDMFPRTYDIHLINSTHVETVCLLSRKERKKYESPKEVQVLKILISMGDSYFKI